MKIFRYLFLLLPLLISGDLVAKEKSYDYKVNNKHLELFGYRLATNHLPRNDGSHSVIFSDSPDSKYTIILSSILFEGKYNAWLYDKTKKTKPLPINVTNSGRHPILAWHSNDIFSIDWGGMGYYVSSIFSIVDIRNEFFIEDPILIDTNSMAYVVKNKDPLTTGIIVGKLFDTSVKTESFPLKLPATISVMDTYESVESVRIKGKKIVVTYKEKGKLKKYKFSPVFLK